MNIYVASHCLWAGCYVADKLRKNGHYVTSRWLTQEFKPTDHYTTAVRQDIAVQDMLDVMSCDVLVLIAGPDRYSGGKFVEAGIAIGAGKRVIVMGRRENMLLWNPDIDAVDTPDEVCALLNPPLPKDRT